jgi:hypothetical protein
LRILARLDALTQRIRDMQHRLNARMFRDTELYLARAAYVSDLGEEGEDRARNAGPTADGSGRCGFG